MNKTVLLLSHINIGSGDVEVQSLCVLRGMWFNGLDTTVRTCFLRKVSVSKGKFFSIKILKRYMGNFLNLVKSVGRRFGKQNAYFGTKARAHTH